VSGPIRPVAEDELQAFVDDFLDATRRAEVEQYLRSHPDVAERVRMDRARRDDLRSAFAQFAEAPVPAFLNVGSLVETRILRHQRARWHIAAAMVLTLFGGMAGGWLLAPRPPAGVDLIAEEAAASYDVFTVDQKRPVELWSAERDDLSSWVSNRLKHPITPPDLSNAGYKFLGGRLAPTAHGPAAMFMYENDAKSRLIVFVRPMTTGRSTGIEQVDAGKLDVCAWITKGVGYSVIAHEPYERLLDLSRDVREQTDRGG
jgi:anti-sigma factor RsiW